MSRALIARAFIFLWLGAVAALAPAQLIFQTAHTFGTTITDGSYPRGQVSVDSQGDLFGTSSDGGQHGDGMVWEVTATGTFKDLHDFGSGYDGWSPWSNVAIDKEGNLYGTTTNGGLHNCGMVWEIKTSSGYLDLHDFAGAEGEGATPTDMVAVDSEGNLYGTTQAGGSTALGYGSGVAWEISAAGDYSVLHVFDGGADGFGASGVTLDSQGDQFGVAGDGGPDTYGFVWEIAANGSFHDLYDFTTNNNVGLVPYGDVSFDAAGNMYGATIDSEATSNGPIGPGTVWELTPSGTATNLYTFPIAETQANGVASDPSGNLFGTTPHGGENDCGIVWEITNSGTFLDLAEFGDFPGQPSGTTVGITLDSNLNLYGETMEGGSSESGVIWSLAQCAPTSTTLSPAQVADGSSAKGTVTLVGHSPAGGGIVVDLASSVPNSVSVPATVTVPANATSATFTISTKANSGNYSAVISATVGSFAKQATLQVGQDPVTSVSATPNPIFGGAGSTGTVTLTNPAPTGGWTVNLSSSDPNYVGVPASVTVAAGATDATFPITTIAYYATYTAAITATSETSKAEVEVTVETEKVSSISFATNPVIGNAGTTGTITMSLPAPTGGWTVTLSSNKPTFAVVPASVTVAAGASSATFPITTKEYSSTYTAAITATSDGGKTVANLTVETEDVLSVTFAANPVIGTAGTTGTVTVSVPATAGGLTVNLSSSNAGYVGVPATVVVASGATSATFPITTKAYPSNYSATVKASCQASTASANLTVEAFGVSSVSFATNPVTGDAGTTGTVTLTFAAPAGGCTVSLSSGTPGFVGVQASVTIPAGQTQATFAVTTKAYTSTYTAVVTATGGSTKVAADLTVDP